MKNGVYFYILKAFRNGLADGIVGADVADGIRQSFKVSRLGVGGVLLQVGCAIHELESVEAVLCAGQGADRGGAEISGNPLWLASALERIEGAARRTRNAGAESNPATAHMFIINPLNGEGRDNLFSTHPATGNRVAELRKLAQAMAAGRAQG